MRHILCVILLCLSAVQSLADTYVSDRTITTAAACSRNTYIAWLRIETGLPLASLDTEMNNDGATLEYYEIAKNALANDLVEVGGNKRDWQNAQRDALRSQGIPNTIVERLLLCNDPIFEAVGME